MRLTLARNDPYVTSISGSVSSARMNVCCRVLFVRSLRVSLTRAVKYRTFVTSFCGSRRRQSSTTLSHLYGVPATAP